MSLISMASTKMIKKMKMKGMLLEYILVQVNMV